MRLIQQHVLILIILRTSFEHDYILDIGVTQYMNFHRDYFLNNLDIKLNPLYLVNGTTRIPEGKGWIKVFLPEIGEKWISNVWFVPTFKKNFLSFISIRQPGHQTIMQDGLVKINLEKDNLKIVMKGGYEDENILRMKGKVIPRKHDFVGASNFEISSFRLCHFRFGHLNFEILLNLKSQDFVDGFPAFKRENSKCEACVFSNEEWEYFSTNSRREIKCL